MKKNLLFTLLISLSPSLIKPESGALQILMEEKKESLQPNQSFTTGVALLGLAAITAHEYQKSQQVTRGVTESLLLPLLYAGLGACSMGYLVYRFIGHEMGIIIQSQQTLKSLEGDICNWQKLLPQLQQNQADVSKKLQTALKVLDTITPLISKLTTQDGTLLDPRVDALQKQISDLKDLVSQLSSLQSKPGQQAVFSQKLDTLVQTSAQVFGPKRR